MSKADRYQLFGKLRTEEYAALEADILKRGVMVAVEKDEDGNTLDGHHREEIAEKHGLTFKTLTRRFKTEEEKREHVIKLNLARRHLEPWQWGKAFKLLLETRGVTRGKGGDRRSSAKVALDTIEIVAKEVGVPLDTAKKRLRAADTLAALPAKAKAAVENRETTLAKASRQLKTERRNKELQQKPKPLPDGKFRVLLCDPPWKYDFAETDNRKIENQYPTMTVEQISAIAPPAADNCVLFMWATAPKLREALVVLEKWGFEYKTHAVWDKQKLGMGYWFRGRHELLLVGVKGIMSPPPEDKRTPSVFSSARAQHSKKPEASYTLIEAMYPKEPKCEMFARAARKGWVCWGNEV